MTGAAVVPVDSSTQLRRLVAVCSRLSAIASQQTDLSTVARFLAASTDSVVAVLDRSLDPLTAAGGADPAEAEAVVAECTVGLTTVLAAVARNRRALTVPGRGRAVVVAPVSVGDDVAGYLLTIGSDHATAGATGGGEDILLLAAEHAAMVCGILLGRELVVAAAAGRVRRELVEGLLLARGQDDGEATRWAHHLGFDDSREYVVLAAASDDGGHQLENLLGRLAPDAIVTARTDEVVAVVPAAGVAGAVERARAVAARCAAESRARGTVVPAMGIGNPCRTAADISRSYGEARRALTAGSRMGEPGAVTVFAELGIHRLLLQFPDVAGLRSFAHEVIGALVDQEDTTGLEYLRTLSVYFAENSSPSRAGQRLHVHPNTVSYRIRRIEEITGLSLDTHQDRLMAEVAVQILDGLGDPR